MAELALVPVGIGLFVFAMVWWFGAALMSAPYLTFLCALTTAAGVWVLYDCWRLRGERDYGWKARILAGLMLIVAPTMLVWLLPEPWLGLMVVFFYAGVVLGDHGYQNSWKNDRKADAYLLVAGLRMFLAPLMLFVLNGGVFGRTLAEEANNTTNGTNNTTRPPPSCHAPPANPIIPGVPGFGFLPLAGAMTLVFLIRRAMLRSRVVKQGNLPPEIVHRIKKK